MNGLFYNNYLNFYWQEDSLRKETINSKFVNKINHFPKTIKDYKSECLNSASIISEKTRGEPIDIFLSGGMDSEVTLNAFLETKSNIRVVIHDMQFNSKDLKDAYHIANKYNVKTKIIKKPIEEICNENQYIINKYLLTEPASLIDIWRSSQTDNYFIISMGEPTLISKGDINTPTAYDNTYPLIKENHNIYDIDNGSDFLRLLWQIDENKPGNFYFLRYTASQYLSVFLDEKTQEWINWSFYFPPSSFHNMKYIFFKKHFPNIDFRYKRNGYEPITELYYNLKQNYFFNEPNFIEDDKSYFFVLDYLKGKYNGI